MKQIFQVAMIAALVGVGVVHAADMTIEVAGLKSAKGKVLVAVYDRDEKFLKEPLRTAAVDAKPGKVSVVISDLPAGDYAISTFQDENGNGELDSNIVGMPIEPYGFGNDATGHFGPPTFEQSRVHLSETGNQFTINLR